MQHQFRNQSVKASVVVKEERESLIFLLAKKEIVSFRLLVVLAIHRLCHGTSFSHLLQYLFFFFFFLLLPSSTSFSSTSDFESSLSAGIWRSTGFSVIFFFLFLFSFLYWRMGFEVLVLMVMQADCFASLHGNTSMNWWVGMYWVFFFNVLVVGLEGNQSDFVWMVVGCYQMWVGDEWFDSIGVLGQ